MNWYLSNGEKVTLTGRTRYSGKKTEYEVIYENGSRGWISVENLYN